MAQYIRKDHFYNKAKAEGYRSRAAYKLKELAARYKLFKPTARVLDLGCAPGGFIQVAVEMTGPDARIVGVDILAVTGFNPPAKVAILKGDGREPAVQQTLAAALGGAADVVLSDMAPNTTGDTFTDHVRSIELCDTAFEIARTQLAPGGHFLVKCFDGEEVRAYMDRLKAAFDSVTLTKPEATRKGSYELYIVAKNFRRPKPPAPEAQPVP